MQGSGRLSSPRTPRSPSKEQTRGGPTPWDVESDISILFCQHSVEEVRKMEQKTRLDIERKKEDLRQMVGERYRDLIDAADSIMDLQTCSEEVEGAVGNMAQVCRSLQQTHFLKGFGGLRGPPSRNETHLVAAQMKLLGSTPEKIWHCLETHRYLQATHLFLLARHTHSQLQLSCGRSSLTQRLWHSTACFKATILDCCTRHLQATDQDKAAMLSSLCAIVLLEGCSLRQVFTQFLLAQKAAVQAVFHPTKQMHCSVKSQVCEVVGVIRRSLIHIASIFCVEPGQAMSLLLKTVVKCTDSQRKDHLEDLIAVDLFSRLPDSVRNFVPTLRTAANEIPAKDIHTSCQEWLTTCVGDVGQGVGQLLQHVTTVRGLSGIREAVYRLLAEPESMTEQGGGGGGGGSEENVRNSWADLWDKLSMQVIGRNVAIWELFLQPLFFDRAKAILTKLFLSAEEHASSTLDQLLRGMTSDPSIYLPDINVSFQLWVEDQAIPGGRRREGGEETLNPLALKAKACTPSVYSFCQSVGEKLQLIVNDAAHYLEPPTQQPKLTRLISEAEEFPFRLHGDHSGMQEFLQQSTNQCVSRFLGKVDQQVTELRDQLESQQTGLPTAKVIDSLLLIARICQSLTEFCLPLSFLSCGCKSSCETSASSSHGFSTGVRSRDRKATSMLRRKEDQPQHSPTKQLLRTRVHSIHRIWAEWCAQQFSLQFQDQLLSSTDLNALSSTLVWDEITISEEDESGKQVTSVIKVPAQASVYVSSLLYAACQEVSRIGGHAMERNVLLFFSGSVLRRVLQVHLSLLASLGPGTAMPQNCALQLLFNVKFLSSVLAAPKDMEEETGKLMRAVTDQLQAHIDPFDLDVFMPYLLSALERQLQRSTVLFGMFLALKGPSHLLMGQKRPSSATQEKHIVIPLAQAAPRFPSLPTSATPQQHKPFSKHIQLSEEETQAPRTFSETIAFFHHL